MQELEVRVLDLEKQLATERAQALVDRALAEEAPFVHPIVRELANNRVVALAAERDYSPHRVSTAIRKFLATPEIQDLLASINYAKAGAVPEKQQGQGQQPEPQAAAPAKRRSKPSLSEMLGDLASGGAQMRMP